MTSPDLATASHEAEVCPYLGLPDDPRTRFTFADPAHRRHVGAGNHRSGGAPVTILTNDLQWTRPKHRRTIAALGMNVYTPEQLLEEVEPWLALWL